ncbi:uncharacterized protein LOC5511178 [Nematostella vectensis]|uniref:uncharacterized protein LOC5511178 n=1 Tax=Nematostella vectensis TaxID=45351 RepID=UPI0013905727|nr:uncharacterized protein LOC5511178 [Nematostella vectensis]
MGSYHIAYHMEAQRKARVIERKHDALEKLAKKMAEEQTDDRSQTREGTRATTRDPRATRDYRQLIPPKPQPTHQWRDLHNNHLQHDARLINRPYASEAKKGIDQAYWDRRK